MAEAREQRDSSNQDQPTDSSDPTVQLLKIRNSADAAKRPQKLIQEWTIRRHGTYSLGQSFGLCVLQKVRGEIIDKEQ